MGYLPLYRARIPLWEAWATVPQGGTGPDKEKTTGRRASATVLLSTGR
jgi:hypothetical protein